MEEDKKQWLIKLRKIQIVWFCKSQRSCRVHFEPWKVVPALSLLTQTECVYWHQSKARAERNCCAPQMIALASGARVAPAFLIFPPDVVSLILGGSLPLPGTGMVRSQLSPIGMATFSFPYAVEELGDNYSVHWGWSGFLGYGVGCAKVFGLAFTTSSPFLRGYQWVGVLVEKDLAFKTLLSDLFLSIYKVLLAELLLHNLRVAYLQFLHCGMRNSVWFLVHMVTSPCLRHHKLWCNLYIFFHIWSLIYPESLPADCYSLLNCQRRTGHRSGQRKQRVKSPFLIILASIQHQCVECERKTLKDY